MKHRGGHLIAHSITTRFNAGEDGSGRGMPPCLTPWDAQAKRVYSQHAVAATLSTSDGKGGQRTQYVEAMGVRRLTPTECELLQGFPPGWTCLCQPLEQYDSLKCTCADGPRYKTMGNAVTVPVIVFLGRRILAVHASLR